MRLYDKTLYGESVCECGGTAMFQLTGHIRGRLVDARPKAAFTMACRDAWGLILSPEAPKISLSDPSVRATSAHVL